MSVDACHMSLVMEYNMLIHMIVIHFVLNYRLSLFGYIVEFILYIILYTIKATCIRYIGGFDTIQCTIYTVQCTVYSVLCTIYKLHLYNIYNMYNVRMSYIMRNGIHNVII